MPTVRLFASVAEAAGTRETTIDAATLGELLRAAEERYGPTFASQLAHCRVVVNGESATDPSTPVGDDDEVAILPPVSGGAVREPGPSGWRGSRRGPRRRR